MSIRVGVVMGVLYMAGSAILLGSSEQDATIYVIIYICKKGLMSEFTPSYQPNKEHQQQLCEVTGLTANKALAQRRELWTNFGVKSNPHLVKRAYELGFLPTPEELPLLYPTLARFTGSLALTQVAETAYFAGGQEK